MAAVSRTEPVMYAPSAGETMRTAGVGPWPTRTVEAVATTARSRPSGRMASVRRSRKRNEHSTRARRGHVVDDAILRDVARRALKGRPVVEVRRLSSVDDVLHGVGHDGWRDGGRQLQVCKPEGHAQPDVSAKRGEMTGRWTPCEGFPGLRSRHAKAQGAVEREAGGPPGIERRGVEARAEPEKIEQREVRFGFVGLVLEHPAERFAAPLAEAGAVRDVRDTRTIPREFRNRRTAAADGSSDVRGCRRPRTNRNEKGGGQGRRRSLARAQRRLVRH